MFEKLKNEVDIPAGAERTVRILLLIENLSHESVKEIVTKGRTERRIRLLADAVKKKYPIDFVLECDDPNSEDVMESVIEAIDQCVPLWMIRQMHECNFSAASIRKIAAANVRGIAHKSLRLAIKKDMDSQQVKLIVDALSLYNTYEQVEVIADPELDWYQMQTILRLYVYGLTVNEAKSIVSPLANCKRLMEMGQSLIMSRKNRSGGAEDENCRS